MKQGRGFFKRCQDRLICLAEVVHISGNFSLDSRLRGNDRNNNYRLSYQSCLLMSKMTDTDDNKLLLTDSDDSDRMYL